MELGKTSFSPELTRQMVWLSSLLPYGQASEVMRRIGKRLIGATSLWEQVQRHGPRLKAYVDAQQERVSVERVVLPGNDLDIRRGVSMDGGMIHIRDEGWKEFKVGTVFDIELRLERDAITADLDEHPHALNTTYCAVLGTPEDFAPALWVEAVAHQIPQALYSCVTADGAEWIWNLVADYFPDSMQIIDWYHACQHLALAAAALFPDSPDQSALWFKQRCEDLYRGEVHKITLPLDHAGLSQQVHYFHQHKRRMQYQAFFEEGYPIGSGTVESGIKQFKARLTGAGMCWSRLAAQHMLLIRTATLSNSFDALWDAA